MTAVSQCDISAELIGDDAWPALARRRLCVGVDDPSTPSCSSMTYHIHLPQLTRRVVMVEVSGDLALASRSPCDLARLAATLTCGDASPYRSREARRRACAHILAPIVRRRGDTIEMRKRCDEAGRDRSRCDVGETDDEDSHACLIGDRSQHDGDTREGRFHPGVRRGRAPWRPDSCGFDSVRRAQACARGVEARTAFPPITRR